MSQHIEESIEKVSVQPLVQDPTFVNPSTDDDGAQGIVLTVYCTTTPNDGDVAVYVAANTRFELQAASSSSEPVTVEDGMGGFELIFTVDGRVIYF